MTQMPTGGSLRRQIIGPDGRDSGQTRLALPYLSDHPLFVVPALLGRHQCDLLEGMGGRRFLGDERQLQVTDDPVRSSIPRTHSPHASRRLA